MLRKQRKWILLKLYLLSWRFVFFWQMKKQWTNGCLNISNCNFFSHSDSSIACFILIRFIYFDVFFPASFHCKQQFSFYNLDFIPNESIFFPYISKISCNVIAYSLYHTKYTRVIEFSNSELILLQTDCWNDAKKERNRTLAVWMPPRI